MDLLYLRGKGGDVFNQAWVFCFYFLGHVLSHAPLPTEEPERKIDLTKA